MVKAKVLPTANITSKGSNNNHAPPPLSSARSNNDPSGAVGPRSGTYRPCARCRVKKTRCDRLQPSCSHCLKGGVEAICVYDNDEPTAAEDTTNGSTFPSTMPSTTEHSTTTDTSNSVTPSSAGVKMESENPGRKTGPLGPAAMTTSRPTNGHATRSSTADNSTNGHNNSSGSDHSILNGAKVEPSLVTIKRLGQSEPSHKRLKAGGAGTTELSKPNSSRNPTISSRNPTSKSSTLATNESKTRPNKAIDIEPAADTIESRLSSSVLGTVFGCNGRGSKDCANHSLCHPW